MAQAGQAPRVLPITVIDSHNPMPEDAHDHHGSDADGPRSFGRPAPCMLYVADTAISEADIAHEMQHHRAIKPERSRADAACALVVRELLRREVERLDLAASAEPVGRETGEEAAIRTLLEREIERRVPSQDDCLRYYQQNRERFRSPDRIRVRHILLAAPADDVAGRLKSRSEGERLIAELQANPVLFADFAMRHSDCPSKGQGGELGWLEKGQTTPEFERQVFRLREGLAAFPVESRWGYHVVQVDEIAPGEALEFADVRDRIADYLELQTQQIELQHYLLTLQEQYEVRGLDEIEAAAN